MGEERRITDLTAISAFRSNDYIAVDNASEEQTKKLPASVITDEFSAIENVYGAKNLIPYPCNQFSRSSNGITFTDNGDGTVTANGTATADASYNISQRYGVSGGSFSLKNGNYLLSGCEGGSNTTFFIQAGVTKNNVFSLLNKNYDGDTAITVDGDDNSNDSANISVQIVIRSGQTFTNKVFKPMIRLASIQDDTYVPYVPTNKELMSCKLNGELGAKNLLPYPYYHTTKTENGLTITDNGDGTVAITGTATSETTFYLNRTNIGAILGKGTYVLSGCPTDGNRESGYFLEISGRATSADSWTVFTTDIGEGATFTITEAMLNWGDIHVFIRVRSGKAISSAITFKPMIRRIEDTDNTWQPYAKTNKDLTDTFKNQVANKEDEYSPSKDYKVGEHCIQNNVLYKCITPCSPASWAVNQNCFEDTTLTKAVTDLNNDLSKLQISTFGAAINISNYNSTAYTCPCDGYVYIITANVLVGTYVQAEINGKINFRVKGNGSQIGVDSLFVKKGMNIKISGSGGGTAYFYPLST